MGNGQVTHNVGPLSRDDVPYVLFPCIYRPEYVSAMVKSALRLCTRFSEKLRSSEEKPVTLLRSSFSCALCAVENACKLCEGEGNIINRDEAIVKIRTLLKDWIANKEVIGGSVFGYSVQSYFTRSRTSWKGKKELKVNQYHGGKHVMCSKHLADCDANS